MNDDNYLEILKKNKEAVNEGTSHEEFMPLLQWLMNYRPATFEGDDVEYKTSADIRTELAEIVTLDLNAISTIMWRLGYEVSVALTHPAWAMIPAK